MASRRKGDADVVARLQLGVCGLLDAVVFYELQAIRDRQPTVLGTLHLSTYWCLRSTCIYEPICRVRGLVLSLSRTRASLTGGRCQFP